MTRPRLACLWAAAAAMVVNGAAAAATDGPSLESRLHTATFVVSRAISPCKEDCSFRAVVVAGQQSGAAGACYTDVVLERFQISGSEDFRMGFVVLLEAVDRKSKSRTTIPALIYNPFTIGRNNVAQKICLPSSWSRPDIEETIDMAPINSKFGSERRQTTDGMLAHFTSELRGARLGASFGITRGASSRLTKWDSLGWIRASLKSIPPGGEIVLNGEAMGIMTDRAVRLAPSALARMRMRIGSTEVGIASCSIKDEPSADIDVEVTCASPLAPVGAGSRAVKR